MQHLQSITALILGPLTIFCLYCILLNCLQTDRFYQAIHMQGMFIVFYIPRPSIRLFVLLIIQLPFLMNELHLHLTLPVLNSITLQTL